MPEYVTGYSLRAPNANDVHEFYEALRDKKDLTAPSRRYPPSYLNLPPRAGTLPEIDRFDNEFFKFNIKQTDKMDIVIRMMLEVTQEALLDAKIPIASLRGSRTGVYVGHCFSDYLNRQSGCDIDKTGYELVNGAHSMAANKISYFYDLRGPSMVFDTACSSSLVALHQAQKDLQAGIIDRAIVGGASLTLDPHKNQIFGAYSMLSPDGRCYSFDSRANGYCRSEGIAAIVLESTSVCQHGYALLSGSSVNSDGFTSKGITFPSGEAQAQNASDAFRSSGMSVHSIGYVEAHGTGTVAGDSQELNGLLRVLYPDSNATNSTSSPLAEGEKPVSILTTKTGAAENGDDDDAGDGEGVGVGGEASREEKSVTPSASNPALSETGEIAPAEAAAADPRHIAIGSVKSVMGHAEGASGLMSVIKVLLMYEHKVLLPNQNYESTHHSALLDGYFDVVAELTPWPQPQAACISNYGFGGTNAFAILAPGNLDFSASSTAAAAASAAPNAWVPKFGSVADSTADDAWYLEQARLGNDALYAFKDGKKSTRSFSKVALVYSGQGSQWAGMGRALMQSSAVFRETIIRLDKFARAVDPSLTLYEWFVEKEEEEEQQGGSGGDEEGKSAAAVAASSGASGASGASGGGASGDGGWMRKERSGLGITAYQVALTNMLRETVGIQGDFFLGHSLGEVGAGYASGLQTEQQTIEIAIVRSSLAHKILPNMFVLKTTTDLQLDSKGDDSTANIFPIRARNEVDAAAAVEEAKGGREVRSSDQQVFYYYVRDPSLLDLKEDPEYQVFDLTGSMVAVGLEAAVISAAIDDLGLAQTCIACYNSPAGQTVSGAAVEVAQLKEYLSKRHANLFWRDIPTDKVAYHAPHLMCHYDYLVRQFARILGQSCKKIPDAFLCTSVDPALADDTAPQVMDAHYHARNIVQSVYFQQAVERLPADTLVVEVGPHQGLLGQMKRIRTDIGLLGLIKMGSYATETQVASALPKLIWSAGYAEHVAAVSTTAAAAVPKVSPNTRLPLPRRHPFLWNHTREQMTFDYTDFESIGGSAYKSGGANGGLTDGGVEIVYDVAGEHSFLLDHVIQGQPLFPATGHLYTLWAAMGLDKGVDISDFEIMQAVPLDPATASTVTFTVHQTGADVWIMKDGTVAARAIVTVQDAPLPPVPAAVPIDAEAAKTCNAVLDRSSLYNHFKRFGYEYSTCFRLVEYRSIPSSMRDRPENGSAITAATAPVDGMTFDGFAVLSSAVHVIAWLDVMLQLFLEDLRLLRLPTLLRRVNLRPGLIASVTAKDAAPSRVFIDTSTKRLVGDFAMFQELHTLPATKSRTPARLVHATQSFVPLGVHELDDRQTHTAIEEAANWMAARLRSHLEAHPEEVESKPWLQNVLQHATKRTSSKNAVALQDLSSDLLLSNPLGAMAYHTYSDLPAMLANPLRCISLAPEHEIFYSRPDNQAFAMPMDVLEKCVQLVVQEWQGSGLCVLEGGIGTGGLTRRLWPLVLPYLEKYMGLDVSAIVPGDAIDQDARFHTLHHNLNEPLPEESDGTKYHLFCASNAIHVTHDIATTLRHLCASLHDGGYLLLEEFVENDFCLYLWGLDPSIWSMPNPDVPRSFGLWMSWGEWQKVIAQVPELEIVLSYRTQVRLTLLLRRRTAETKALWSEAIETKTDWKTIDATCAVPQRFASQGAMALFRTLVREYSHCTLHTATVDTADAQSIALVAANPFLRHIAVQDGQLGAWVTTVYPPTSLASTAAVNATAHVPSATSGGDPSALALSIQRPGDLATLTWCPMSLQSDMPTATCVDVEFAGLNFKDVMYAFGKLRLEKPSFGLEVAGRTADNRSVMGIGRTHCIATRTMADMTWTVPPDMTLAEAATVPVVYLTALYAMFEKARLEAGQSMLVHGGAGGVGHAAIHLAQRRGIEVFTTCSAHKRAHMKKWFGLDDAHIGNSRDLTFVEMVLAGTEGEGVDMVLNCLSGPALNASLTLVKDFGHFCEIGKYDLQNNTRIGVKVFECNVSYHAIDLATMFTHKHYTKVLQRLLQNALDSGDVRALPLEVFSANQVADGLRYLSAGKHVGKVLISMADAHERESALASSAAPVADEVNAATMSVPSAVRFLTSGTHIITGGLGGFGMELAHWLADCGAQRIVLTSRSGTLRSGWQRVRFEALRRHPTLKECLISTADVGDRDQCRELVSSYGAALRGVWHAAMVLEDMTFAKQTEDAWAKVHFAKCNGTAHLDEMTRQFAPALDAFVVFSSIVALHGNIGQAAYAHANAVCEWVVQQRNAAGMCAAAVQWGAIDNVGFVSQHADDIETSISQYALQNVDDSLECLHKWAQHRGVVTSYCPNELDADQADSSARAVVASVEDVQTKFASVLGGKANDYDPDTAVQTYGLDSLSSTVLVNWVNQQLAQNQITVEFFDDGMTIAKMYGYIMAHKRSSE